MIHQLRGLDVPLGEVARIVATGDPAARADLVSTHLGRLEDQLERTHAVPVDTSDQARWRTEIGWPVFRIAAR